MSALPVPPGILDPTTQAITSVLDRWDSIGVERVLVWHMPSVIEGALPHLADGLGVRDLRYVDGPTRDFVRRALAFMRTRGTPGALRRALEVLGHTGILVQEDTLHHHDGEIHRGGQWTHGSEAHWATFFVFVETVGPMPLDRLRELWDAVAFMAPVRSPFVLAVSDLADPGPLNLLDDPTGWPNGFAAVAFGGPDPIGGTGAVVMTDASVAGAERADTSSVALLEARHVDVSVWLRKDPAATHAAGVQVHTLGGGGPLADVLVDLATGQFLPRLTSVQGVTLQHAVADMGDWWFLTVRSFSPASTVYGWLRIYPAGAFSADLGTFTATATGSVTVFAPRIAYGHPTASLPLGALTTYREAP